MIQMRPSRVLKKLREGKIAKTIKLNLDDVRAAEIAAMSGFDCLWLDMEHIPNSLQCIENCVRAGKLHDCDTMVRVKRGSYSDLVYPLEMDATGIMAPHVMSETDAKEIVRFSRFHPIGRRPLDDGTTTSAYCRVPLKDLLRDSNLQRFVIAQIEDPEPMEEIEAIAQIEGIDILFFGPGDFSHAIGAPGEFNHPKVLEARKRVAQVAQRNGKFAGTPATPDTLEPLIEMGYRFLSMGADVVGLGQYYEKILSIFKSYEQ